MSYHILPFCLVFDQNKNILLLHKIDRQKREPVKGGIQEGETPKEAIIRELYEETGIQSQKKDIKEINVITIGGIQKITYKLHLSKNKPLITINCVIEGGEDHDNYGRFSFNELKKLTIEYKEELLDSIEKALETLNS